MKKYSKLYEQMILYYTKVTTEVWSMTDKAQIEDIVSRHVNNMFPRAVKLIQQGKYTEDEAIAVYPLN